MPAAQSADALLDQLDPEQREVALALTGPVCVLAGAGTGKTRAITHRIAYGVRTGTYAPSAVLALTFTTKAAGEMLGRLRALGASGVQARTFHAAALRQLSFFWPQVVGGPVPRLVEAKGQLVADAARRLGLDVDRLTVRDLAAEIEWSKVCLVAAEDYPRAASYEDRPLPEGFDHGVVSELITSYEHVKTAAGRIDFEDVLILLADLLAGERDIAEQVRRQYRHLVVDEYQDVSPAQQHLLDQWLGARHEVCVVGDPNQTIFSFAGATHHYLTTFADRHPGTRTLELVRDYRSTPQVVDLANRMMAAAPRAARIHLELLAQRPPGPEVEVSVFDDVSAEAAGVVDAIRSLASSGVPLREIAVLFRTNAQSAPFEEALGAAGIAYSVAGGEPFFARDEVRKGILLLRGAARSMADVPLGEAVRDVLTSAGWGEVPPGDRGGARERWESLRALVDMADAMAAAPRPDASPMRLTDLVAELDDRAASRHAPSVDAVTLASLHSAKGLEWDAVFVAGLSDGLVPVATAVTGEQIDEERRLLYVGVTRAREHLHLTWARSRAGGRGSRRRTRFLRGVLPDVTVEPAARSDASLSEAGLELYEALRAWRSEVADLSGTPPHGVLTDATLRAVARARPTSLELLGQVRGIGASKLDLYGAAVLDVVAAARRRAVADGA
jgi:DNA helicase-2/ATP-dependent DNA helicase PcrA